jgi:hypothetical protein
MEDEEMKITSSAFDDHGTIPRKHTCEGIDVSPPLAIEGVPAGAQGLALIVDDPDAPDPAAPRMTWVHWVLYDLPPETTSLPEGVASSILHARDGLNDWKRIGYGGPCPPIGRHRYFFKLFALDRKLGDLHRPTSTQLQGAFSGHVVAEAQLVGLYAKER